MWLWWVVARAEPEAPMEITVEGTRLSTAQLAVHRELRQEGYLKLVRLGQRSYYLQPMKLWKPNVMIHSEGFSRVRGVRAMPVMGLYQTQESRYEAKSGWKPAVNTVPFATQSKRQARAQAERLAGQLEPLLAEVRDARWEMARAERAIVLREELNRIWLDGLGPDGERLPDMASRRSALLARWRDTSEGPAGAWAREIVLSFVESEVQPTAPFSDAEIEVFSASP
jgi:hypothetical protein